MIKKQFTICWELKLLFGWHSKHQTVARRDGEDWAAEQINAIIGRNSEFHRMKIGSFRHPARARILPQLTLDFLSFLNLNTHSTIYSSIEESFFFFNENCCKLRDHGCCRLHIEGRVSGGGRKWNLKLNIFSLSSTTFLLVTINLHSRAALIAFFSILCRFDYRLWNVRLIWKSSHWKSLFSNQFYEFLSLAVVDVNPPLDARIPSFDHESLVRGCVWFHQCLRGEKWSVQLLNWGWNWITFALFDKIISGRRFSFICVSSVDSPAHLKRETRINHGEAELNWIFHWESCSEVFSVCVQTVN